MSFLFKGRSNAVKSPFFPILHVLRSAGHIIGQPQEQLQLKTFWSALYVSCPPFHLSRLTSFSLLSCRLSHSVLCRLFLLCMVEQVSVRLVSYEHLVVQRCFLAVIPLPIFHSLCVTLYVRITQAAPLIKPQANAVITSTILSHNSFLKRFLLLLPIWIYCLLHKFHPIRPLFNASDIRSTRLPQSPYHQFCCLLSSL
jgi:hypothetical protein